MVRDSLVNDVQNVRSAFVAYSPMRVLALLLHAVAMVGFAGTASCASADRPQPTVESGPSSGSAPVAMGVTNTQVPGRPIGVVSVEGEPWVALSGVGSVLTPAGKVNVGEIPLRVAVAKDGVWVSVFGDGSLVRVTSDARVVQRVDLGVGAEPEGVAADGERLWVVDQNDGALLALDARTGARTGRVEVGYGPRLLTVGPNDVWVTTYGTGGVSAVDRQDVTVRVARTDVCRGVQGIAQTAGVVWVACTTDNVVLALSTESLTEVARFPLPNADAVVAQGDRVIAVGQKGPTALVIDARMLRVDQTLLLGDAPIVGDGNIDAALDHDHLFVTHPETNTLYDLTLSH